MPGGGAIEPLGAGMAEALARPEGHPHDPSATDGVGWIQTHLSHVFLTRERVYKVRKAVDLGFVHFGSRAERNADCMREVRLNRRLAPDVYLGVAPILGGAAGRFQVGPVSEELAPPYAAGRVSEHCVVMRRLPDDRDALHLLESASLRRGHLDAVAARIAAFHEEQRLGVPAPFTPEAWRAAVWTPMEDTLHLLEESDERSISRETLHRVRLRAERFFAEHGDLFERRRREGRAVEGHGDLHLQHVWFERDEAEPLIIDCLEFRDDLRRIDAAADVAFLAMDLIYRGRRDLAERFLRRYARVTDDYDLYVVVDYYAAYRAAVRAKVAALAARDAEIEAEQREQAAQSARRHLDLAGQLLAAPAMGNLVLLCGIVGTGKSTVAERVADLCEGVVVSSDRVRKRLAGLEVGERGEGVWRRGLYAPARTEAVYRGLLERAERVMRSGRTAVLDATYGSRVRRDAAHKLAKDLGAGALLVETRCARAEALGRLEARQAADRDPSDAGPELYAPIAAAFEAPEEWPDRLRIVVETDHADWENGLRAALASLAPDLRVTSGRTMLVKSPSSE